MTVLLEVRDLVKHFPVHQGVFSAQDRRREGRRRRLLRGRGGRDARPGRRVGLRQVDDRTVPDPAARSRPPARSLFEGKDVRTMRGADLKAYRREVQIIFQDPYASLNPRMTIGEIVTEPLLVHRIGHARGAHAARQGAARGRRPESGAHQPLPARVLGRPAAAHRHRPRARAQPEADRLRRAGLGARRLDPGAGAEPARRPAGRVRPDVPLHRPRPVGRAAHLRSRRRHVPRRRSSRSATGELYERPHHPYTQSLLSAVPVPDPEVQRTRERILLPGDPPTPIDPPTGCRFHTRCPIAQFPICAESRPELREVAPGHRAACHFAAPFPITLGSA